MRRGIPVILLFTLLFMTIAGYALLEEWQWDDTPEMTIEITSGRGTEEISCWEADWGEYYVFLPSYADLSQVRLRTHTFRTVRLDKTSVTDGMTCENIELNHTYGLVYNGEDYYPITFLRSANVPTMYIDTASGSMDYIHEVKGNKEAGTMRLYAEDGTLTHLEVLESIKGRGNGTWIRSKKPYSVTLSSQSDLLGMGEAKRWILLANAYDYSNLRNKLVYDLAQKAQLSFSPECHWVDLYLNGEYAGLYLLSERNEVHPNRVDIPQENSFLVSMELYDRLVFYNYPYAQTQSGTSFRIHHAGMETSQIQQLLQSVENAIFAEDGIDPVTQKSWDELIDVDSWARKYLLEEIFANYDTDVSQYFYYTDGKLYAGPVWDYDISLASGMAWQTRSPQAILTGRQYIRDLTTPLWVGMLYNKDSFFQYVSGIYRDELRPMIEILLEESWESYTQIIPQASVVNAVRRNIDEPFAEQERMKSFLAERISFLDSLLIEGDPYCYVHIYNEMGAWGCFAVRPGEQLTNLPPIEDKDGRKCLGWYDAFTNEPFDVSQPIYENAVIQMKWE